MPNLHFIPAGINGNKFGEFKLTDVMTLQLNGKNSPDKNKTETILRIETGLNAPIDDNALQANQLHGLEVTF